MGAISAIKATINQATSVDDTLATALALFLLGSRTRVKVLGHHANLWLLSVGESSVTHKSTAERVMLSGLYTKPHVFGTLEGLKKAWLATDEDGGDTIVLVADEFGSVLKQAKAGSAGYKVLIDALNTLHEGKGYVFPETARESVEIPSGIRVSLVASTTPEAFHRNVSEEILQGGLFKRLLVVMPTQAEYVPPWAIKDVEATITKEEGEWDETCDEVQLSEGVKTRHAEFMRAQMDTRNWAGFWQRGERMMLDIAAMHCALERGKKTINIKDWEFAMQIVARSIASQKILVGSGGV